MPRIISIVYQPDGRKYKDPKGDFLRVPTDSVELVTAHGIRGDQKAGRSKSRQLNLLTDDWLKQMAEQGYRTAPGQFGEQIILEGLPFADLKPGLRLGLGESAVIELTKPRTGCDRLESAQGKAIPIDTNPAIGYLSTIFSGGMIRVGDTVRILETDLK